MSSAPTVLNIVPGVFSPLDKGMLNTLKKWISMDTNLALSHTSHWTERIQGQLMQWSQRESEIWWFADHQHSSRSYPLMRSPTLRECDKAYEHSGQKTTWVHMYANFVVQFTLPVDSLNVQSPLVRNPSSTSCSLRVSHCVQHTLGAVRGQKKKYLSRLGDWGRLPGEVKTEAET